MGKTSTVIETIMQLICCDASFEILACALSNAAVDALVERLASAGLTADQLLHLKAPSADTKSVPTTCILRDMVCTNLSFPSYYPSLVIHSLGDLLGTSMLTR